MSALPKISGQKPEGYAGDVEPSEAWRVLSGNSQAVLVDVRTRAEWGYVGLPNLTGLNKKVVLQEWQSFPSMDRQLGFEVDLVQQLSAASVAKSTPILFLCRSGVRSLAAAVALHAEGFEFCYNVKDGFEGPMNEEGHRGTVAGWKASNLPWAQ